MPAFSNQKLVEPALSYANRSGARGRGRTTRTTAVRRCIIIAVATAAVLAAGTGPALAGTSGAQRITIITAGSPGTPSTAILTGTLTALGTSTNSETSGILVLADGTISVTHVPSRVDNVFDPVTCMLRLDEAGPYQFTSGTGRYSGIFGQGSFTVTGVVVFGRTPTGCAPAPSSEFVIVRTVGTTTLG